MRHHWDGSWCNFVYEKSLVYSSIFYQYNMYNVMTTEDASVTSSSLSQGNRRRIVTLYAAIVWHRRWKKQQKHPQSFPDPNYLLPNFPSFTNSSTSPHILLFSPILPTCWVDEMAQEVFTFSENVTRKKQPRLFTVSVSERCIISYEIGWGNWNVVLGDNIG